MDSDAALLAFVYGEALDMLADGPSEITTLRPDDTSLFARALTAAFAMGIEPGAHYDRWTPWPLDLADSAAQSLPEWIMQRHDQWPEEDPGAVFEYLGTHLPQGRAIKAGQRRRPVRAPRALFLARSWAEASPDRELIAAATALLLLTEELLDFKKPTRTADGWDLRGTVPDPRAVLLSWCARILDDPEPAAELAAEAFATVTGWEYPSSKVRRPREVEWRDGPDPRGVEAYLPILRRGLDLAAVARRDGQALAGITADSRDELVALAATVQAIAGPHDIVASTRKRQWAFTWGSALVDQLDGRAGRFLPHGDVDPLDVVPHAQHSPDHYANEDAARAHGSIEASIFAELEPVKGVTTAAHIVPAAAAVLRSRELTGSWWQRAVAHLERFTTHVVGDEDPRYFDDLAALDGSRPANDAGLVLLTCRDLDGTRNYETVRALVDAYRAGG